MNVVSSRNDGPPIGWPTEEPYLGQSIRFWIEVLHRRSVEDAARMNRIEERLDRLERRLRWRRSRPRRNQ